jgi:hypothetical protein
MYRIKIIIKIKIKNCDAEGKVSFSVVHRSTETLIVMNIGKNSSEYFSTRYWWTKYGAVGWSSG